MDVTDVLRRLLRLRLAVAVVIVIALVAALVGYTTAGSSRQSRAAVVIVPPKVANETGGDNPLLNLDNNLAQLAVVLSGALGSQAVADALAKDGATADFSVSTVTGDNPSFSQLSPQLVFTVTGSSDAVTERTATGLVEQSGAALNQLQDRAGVPASARASVVEVTAPTTPVAVSGGRLRSAGTLGVGIVVLGLLLVLAVDAIRRRRAVTAGTDGTADGGVAEPAARQRRNPFSTLRSKVLAPPPTPTLPSLPTARAAKTAPAVPPPPKDTPAKKTSGSPPVKAPAKALAKTPAKTPAKKVPAKKGIAAPKTPPVRTLPPEKQTEPEKPTATDKPDELTKPEATKPEATKPEAKAPPADDGWTTVEPVETDIWSPVSLNGRANKPETAEEDATPAAEPDATPAAEPDATLAAEPDATPKKKTAGSGNHRSGTPSRRARARRARG